MSGNKKVARPLTGNYRPQHAFDAYIVALGLAQEYDCTVTDLARRLGYASGHELVQKLREVRS